jgi:transcriptional regulator with XRE-family HTH domain
MSIMNERIVVLRKHFKLSQTKFALAIGVTSQLVNKIEGGSARLTEEKIRLICLAFGVNEMWLREGAGEMLHNMEEFSDYERRLLDLFRQLSPRARQMLVEYAEKLQSDEEALRREGAQEKRATG